MRLSICTPHVLPHVIAEAFRVSAVSKLPVDEKELYFIMYGDRYKYYYFLWLTEPWGIIK